MSQLTLALLYYIYIQATTAKREFALTDVGLSGKKRRSAISLLRNAKSSPLSLSLSSYIAEDQMDIGACAIFKGHRAANVFPREKS